MGRGGAGEFRSIEFVLPLLGDTILVVDRSRLVWALRDGTYLEQEILPFQVREYAVHDGRIWLVGRTHRDLLLQSLDETGRPQRRATVRTSAESPPSGYLGSTGRALSVWEYPRGPLHRVDSTSGEVVDSVDPFPQRPDEEWRAFAEPGPSGSIFFDFLFRQYFAPGFAWTPLYVQDPIELWAGVRILEVLMGG